MIVGVLHIRRKSVIRTFRLDDITDEVLSNEAERQGITVNSLANQIFKKFAIYDRYTMRHKFISFTLQIFEVILGICDGKLLAASGETAGSEFSREALKTLGLSHSRESVIRVIRDIASRSANWYDCEFHPFNGQEGVLAMHTLGEKWSLFLAGFFRAFMKSVLNVQIDPEITSHSVFFKLPPTNDAMVGGPQEN